MTVKEFKSLLEDVDELKEIEYYNSCEEKFYSNFEISGGITNLQVFLVPVD